MKVLVTGGAGYIGSITAHKLAEALVGMDFLGFHPNADFRTDGRNNVINIDGSMTDNALLYNIPPVFNPWPTLEQNIQTREGQFVELENANAFRMMDVYDTSIVDGTFRRFALALCDVFVSRRVSGKKTGMPILYYRARTNYSQQDSQDPDEIYDDIYHYPDNFQLINLGTAEATPLAHPLADNGPGAVVPTPAAGSGSVTSGDDWLDFENIILNRQVTAINRPYRAGSYILISAGKDGRYGTADDLQNFKKEIPF